MQESTNLGAVPIEDVLRSAMILAWDEFSAITAPRAIRVEYLCEPGVRLDELTIWVLSAGGYQERFCDYQTGHVSGRPKEWRCWAKAHSAQLFSALDFIMRHQERFYFAPDAIAHGLIVVFPPPDQERAEAKLWLAAASGANPPPVVRARPGTQFVLQACDKRANSHF
jgi:hypothetical protein